MNPFPHELEIQKYCSSTQSPSTHSRRVGLSNPIISDNQVPDHLNWQVLRILIFCSISENLFDVVDIYEDFRYESYCIVRILFCE